ncbi:hypothetical protein L248_0454 [Schleiferilactobacillus shenzhenensis LY-73]|uniref:Uncharacterized protein n=1 Tax=Schleiferilactobacillus shenzhenensis LY-73 TaxID=1231336 RepID=U4TN63_9LACO|nr:hypothetical protein L248_0454 [Schleiferilactobacillus shenzhenensis LY-73]
MEAIKTNNTRYQMIYSTFLPIKKSRMMGIIRDLKANIQLWRKTIR